MATPPSPDTDTDTCSNPQTVLHLQIPSRPTYPRKPSRKHPPLRKPPAQPTISMSSQPPSSPNSLPPQPVKTPPPSPPRPTPHPARQKALQRERELASAEAALRRVYKTFSDPVAITIALAPALEALGDAYVARVAGHPPDNAHCAVASYALADARFRAAPPLKPANANASRELQRARVLSKLGEAWYSRLCVMLQVHSPNSHGNTDTGTRPVDVHSLLRNALKALDEAVRLFEELGAVPGETDGFMQALFRRGVVCDRLYHTPEVFDVRDWEKPPPPPDEKDSCLKGCIQSLERALAVRDGPGGIADVNAKADVKDGKKKAQSDGDGKESDEKVVPAESRALDGLDRANAMLCLARAYSNDNSSQRSAHQKAEALMAHVDKILGDSDDGEEAERLREQAKEQRLVLSESSNVVESRCIVC